MKQFFSHKVVEAAQIIGIRFDDPLILVLDDGQVLKHPGTTSYQPVARDYYVIYKDGYTSISPQKAFEEGYTEIKGEKT